jgi:hypothetical protein
MPFTPFHMGPGAALKAVAGRHFSLTVFGCAQVFMDIEPLVRMIRGDAVLHGPTHTYFGALLLGLVAFFAGRPFCEGSFKLWNALEPPAWLPWLRAPERISRTAAATGAFLGTGSHVFLDSFMHADMHPYAPFSPANGLLGLMSVGELYLLCVVSGVVGLMVLFVVFAWRKIAIDGG